MPPFSSSPVAFPSPSVPHGRHTADAPWHFPGPSSKYHARAHHPRRVASAYPTTVAVAPTLSTERRAAHRRTQSSAVLVTARRGGPDTLGENGMAGLLPKTPVKGLSAGSRGRSDEQRLQDSPFSDYFTDDGRSSVVNVGTPGGAAAPSAAVQKVLVRLGRLQACVVQNTKVAEVVGTKLEEVEREIAGLMEREGQGIDDSGVFLEDEDGDGDGLGVGHTADEEKQEKVDSIVGSEDVDSTEERAYPDPDAPLAEASLILSHLTQAQEELRQRHAELVQEHDEQQCLEREIGQLRAENEALRSDLGFDHSALLFLKLQLSALEMEVEGWDGSVEPGRERRVVRDLNRWREDWGNIDARLRRRRELYGSSPHGKEVEESGMDEGADEEDCEWRIETQRERSDGKIISITVRRVEGDEESPPPAPTASYFGLDGAADEVEPSTTEQIAPVTKVYADQATQTNLSLSPREDVFSQLFSVDGAQDYHGYAFDEVDEDQADECAITVSPTMALPSLVKERARLAFQEEYEGGRSAWAELWEGLGNLAGLGGV
ncbi:hypothetical protein M433DRAFT_2734 [Acidomyces richmondensis BFW]|nr:MAG: hypothetical protein FE78DRAFT_28759 [Acidomyces sp. 'richmondensis']KYG47540.1 hypothetical protein M433DRAFT_2734 [Acidomyces richmondensis BFW]